MPHYLVFALLVSHRAQLNTLPLVFDKERPTSSRSSALSLTDGQIIIFLHVLFQEGRAYYEQTGVGPLPVVMYNGVPYRREQLDPDELETVTMQKILETTSFYQRAVYLVSSSTNALVFLCSDCMNDVQVKMCAE